MRKKFIYFALIPLVVISIVVYLFMDSWVTSALESAGEAMTGAKVEFTRLSVSVSPIGLKWQGLQVADPKEPMKNLFQTGRVQFALNFGQLLRGKYIIESMEVNNLILGTKRTTSGALPKKPAASKPSGGPSIFSSLMTEASSALGVNKLQTPNFDIASVKKVLNVDSLTNPNNLQSYRMIDSLKGKLQAASAQWQTTLGAIEQTKQKLMTAETNIRAIDVNQLKTVDQIASALNTVKDGINTANEVKQTFTTQETGLTNQVTSFVSSAKAINDAVNQDYNHIVSLARLPDVNMKGLSQLVLGKDIMATADKYMYWIAFAHKHIASMQQTQKEPSPPRLKGQNIRFPEERGYPKFWIKKIVISGGTDKSQNPDYFYASGTVRNITDNQRITGQPMTIDLLIRKGASETLKLDASFDRRTDVPLDVYQAELTGARIGTMTLGRSDFLPSKVEGINAEASIYVKVPGNSFDSESKIQFSNMNVVFETQPKNEVEHIVQQVLQSVKAFNVDLRMWNAGNQFKMAFSTDLDNQLASRAKAVLGAELASFENELRNKLNQQIAAKEKEYEALLAQKRDAVMTQLKGYDSYVNDGIAMLQGKQNDILKKQQDMLKNKANSLLNGLFKH